MSKLLLASMTIAALAVPAALAAESGKQAKLTITTDFDSEFMAPFLEELGDSGGSMETDALSSAMEGSIFWTSSKMRMDIDASFGMEMPERVGQLSTTIYNYDEQVMYTLNHLDKTAFKMDLGAGLSEEGGFGFPFKDPEQMFMNWEESYEQFLNTPGMDLQELGTQTIGGVECHGYSYTYDISRLMEEVEEYVSAEAPGDDAMPGMEDMFGMMGEMSGTIWVSDESSLPIKMETRTMGMSVLWELSEISTWEADDSFFTVPADYEIQDMADMQDMYIDSLEVSE
ncbi:hypothetical protein IIA79_05065 [bacterium]|nr:hypothetical protein [bacterium]